MFWYTEHLFISQDFKPKNKCKHTCNSVTKKTDSPFFAWRHLWMLPQRKIYTASLTQHVSKCSLISFWAKEVAISANCSSSCCFLLLLFFIFLEQGQIFPLLLKAGKNNKLMQTTAIQFLDKKCISASFKCFIE